MIKQVFSIYDEKGQVYGDPFYYTHQGEAVRAVTEAMQDFNTMLAKYPADFKLYALGQFDNTKGIMISSAIPELVCSLSDCLLPVKNLNECEVIDDEVISKV